MIGVPTPWAEEACPSCSSRWWARARDLGRCACCGFYPMIRLRSEIVFEPEERAA